MEAFSEVCTGHRSEQHISSLLNVNSANSGLKASIFGCCIWEFWLRNIMIQQSGKSKAKKNKVDEKLTR